MRVNEPMCLFGIKDYSPFEVLLPKKKIHWKEISNEILPQHVKFFCDNTFWIIKFKEKCIDFSFKKKTWSQF
jgi:hypothetical protein